MTAIRNINATATTGLTVRPIRTSIHQFDTAAGRRVRWSRREKGFFTAVLKSVTTEKLSAGDNRRPCATTRSRWLVTFMEDDLGYFDDETCRLEPIDNPFGPKLLPMSPEWTQCRVASSSIPSWNQIERFLRDMAQLRQ